MLTISGKALGRKKPLFADFSVAAPPALRDGGITLRHLLEHIVREQVAGFQERQEQRQVLRVLTQRQIAEGVEKGKIESGVSQVDLQPVDAEAAVAAAWQAFEDSLYLVVLDEQQQQALEQQVFLQPDSRLTFVRLTMLAGG